MKEPTLKIEFKRFDQLKSEFEQLSLSQNKATQYKTFFILVSILFLVAGFFTGVTHPEKEFDLFFNLSVAAINLLMTYFFIYKENRYEEQIIKISFVKTDFHTKKLMEYLKNYKAIQQYKVQLDDYNKIVNTEDQKRYFTYEEFAAFEEYADEMRIYQQVIQSNRMFDKIYEV